MRISAIVATDLHGAIGKDNQIPWHIPADLQYFKKTTRGHCVIMGRKSYDSIGKPLPGRTNIIITRNTAFQPEGCIVVHSLEEAFNVAQAQNETEAFVIGGGEIFSSALAYIHTLYLTIIHTVAEEADVFFPPVQLSRFVPTYLGFYNKNEKNAFDYTFQVWDKR